MRSLQRLRPAAVSGPSGGVLECLWQSRFSGLRRSLAVTSTQGTGGRMSTSVDVKHSTPLVTSPYGKASTDDAGAQKPPEGTSVPCVRSVDLFGTANEIEIEHGDSRYRLRKTLLGKLIMTK
jgi:hemin uptake protein HemP